MRTTRFSILTLGLALLVGCSSFATLRRVARAGEDVPVSRSSFSVTRGSERIDCTAEMALEAGDLVETTADFGAVIEFSAGASLVMRPETRAALGETAIDLLRGEVLFRPAGGLATLTAKPMTVTPSGAVAVRIDGTGGAAVMALGSSAKVATAGAADRRVDQESVLTGSGTVEPLTRERLNELVAWVNGIDLPQRRLIPDVAGLHSDAASGIIDASYVTATITPVPVDSAQVGIVQAQSPARGSTAAALRLDVGAKAVFVVDVTNRSLGDAEQALRTANLTAGSIEERLSANRDTPLVVAQQPGPGTRVLENAPVRLTVEYPGSIVPRLHNMSQDAAMNAISQARLVGSVSGSGYFRSVAENCVVRSEPSEGTLIRRGAQVSVFLSRGALPAPAASALGQGRVATDAAGTMTLRWSEVPEAVEYQVQITHPSGGVVHDSTVGQGTTSCAVKPRWEKAWAGTPYSWQVRGKANDEWSDWSNAEGFLYEPPDIVIPNLANEDYAQASGRVPQLTPRRVDERSLVPAGRVVRTEPPPGTTLKPGEELVFHVSIGTGIEPRHGQAQNGIRPRYLGCLLSGSTLVVELEITNTTQVRHSLDFAAARSTLSDIVDWPRKQVRNANGSVSLAPGPEWQASGLRLNGRRVPLTQLAHIDPNQAIDVGLEFEGVGRGDGWWSGMMLWAHENNARVLAQMVQPLELDRRVAEPDSSIPRTAQ